MNAGPRQARAGPQGSPAAAMGGVSAVFMAYTGAILTAIAMAAAGLP